MPAPPRIFLKLKGDINPGLRLPLIRSDSHHLLDVLRLKVGAEIVVVDPRSGREFLSSLVSDSAPAIVEIKKAAERAVVKRELVVSSASIALLKGKRLDLAIEKLTELGITRINLYSAEHSLPRIATEMVEEKLARWGRVALAAAKQSQRDSIPEINYYAGLIDLVRGMGQSSAADGNGTSITHKETLLFGSVKPDALNPSKISPRPSRAHLLIGPEGDLTPGEEDLLIRAGFTPISLGPTVLRAETAVIAGVAGLNLLWS